MCAGSSEVHIIDTGDQQYHEGNDEKDAHDFHQAFFAGDVVQMQVAQRLKVVTPAL